jgi:carbon monoxide dehydrogenase subunit G
MVSVSRTFTVDKGVEDVVAYLADFTHAEEWDPGTVTCVPVDSSPVAVGKTWKNTSKIAGVTTEIDYTLERLEPGRVVLVGRNDTATSTDDITVVPHEGGSEVTYLSTVEFTGLAKLGSPVVRLVFEHLANETEESIQKAVARL